MAPDALVYSRRGKQLVPNASTHSLMSRSAKSRDDLRPSTGRRLLLLRRRRRLPDSNASGKDAAASMGLGSVATAAARPPPRDIGIDRTDAGTIPSMISLGRY